MNSEKKRDVRAWIKVWKSGGLSSSGARMTLDSGHAVPPCDGTGIQMLFDQNFSGTVMLGDAHVPYSLVPMLP